MQVWTLWGWIVASSVLFFALATSFTARGQGSSLTLIEVGKPHVYVLPASLELDLDQAAVLDAQTKQGFAYVLLRVSGPSRRGFPMGYCGAGRESALVWLKLHGWKKVELRVEKYESCLYGLEPSKSGWQGNSYGLEYADYRSSQSKTLAYNRAHPERGFSLTARPLTP